MPECTLGRWTPLPLVIDAFLVRAAHNAITHNNRENALAIDELENLAGDLQVVAYVAGFDFPVPHLGRLGILGRYYAYGHFRGLR